MALTEMQHDLGQYALEKCYRVIKDVHQSAEIAGLTGCDSLDCTGSSFLMLSAMIAVVQGMPKDKWLEHCAAVYDRNENEQGKRDSAGAS